MRVGRQQGCQSTFREQGRMAPLFACPPGSVPPSCNPDDVPLLSPSCIDATLMSSRDAARSLLRTNYVRFRMDTSYRMLIKVRSAVAPCTLRDLGPTGLQHRAAPALRPA